MKRSGAFLIFLCFGSVGYLILEESGYDIRSFLPKEQVAPNWAAIAAWPDLVAPNVEAQPDPNRRVTVIVLDDSGSMGSDMAAAKQAVIDALTVMEPNDRVAVVALNAGVVLPFTSVRDARISLPDAISYIASDGTTPLTNALLRAQALLEDEASTMRSFGTFRMIVTTDGEADDGDALDATVRAMAETTPVQMTTIGIGINGGHVLRRSDLGAFVDVENVQELETALQAAVAENPAFEAITDFSVAGN